MMLILNEFYTLEPEYLVIHTRQIYLTLLKWIEFTLTSGYPTAFLNRSLFTAMQVLPSFSNSSSLETLYSLDKSAKFLFRKVSVMFKNFTRETIHTMDIHWT